MALSEVLRPDSWTKQQNRNEAIMRSVEQLPPLPKHATVTERAEWLRLEIKRHLDMIARLHFMYPQGIPENPKPPKSHPAYVRAVALEKELRGCEAAIAAECAKGGDISYSALEGRRRRIAAELEPLTAELPKIQARFDRAQQVKSLEARVVELREEREALLVAKV